MARRILGRKKDNNKYKKITKEEARSITTNNTHSVNLFTTCFGRNGPLQLLHTYENILRRITELEVV